MPFLLHEHRPRCITSQKIVGGDELFKKTVSDVANSVITEFVSSVGDPSTYSKDVAKQFYADTGTIAYEQALDDVRTDSWNC
ncbi:hypothetical protein Y032_0005g2342 [Ancylostoma ceylanicum]|uniref:Uncharacterized protein n=1 Tax=Ancylostoma ceylanicum TaxID=53326 RepID=A0A016VSA8_9BILA|nr:hypothetical protein Y032_0005g2342 [Ancylostoma ceylanicum]